MLFWSTFVEDFHTYDSFVKSRITKRVGKSWVEVQIVVMVNKIDRLQQVWNKFQLNDE